MKLRISSKSFFLIFSCLLIGIVGCSSSSVQPTKASSKIEFPHKYKIISYDVADTHGIVKEYATVNVAGTLQTIDLKESEGDILLEESVDVIEGSFLYSNKPIHLILEEGDTFKSRIHYKISKK